MVNFPRIECPPQATNECFRFLHAVEPLPNTSGDRPLPGCIARARRGEAMVKIQATVIYLILLHRIHGSYRKLDYDQCPALTHHQRHRGTVRNHREHTR